MPGNHIHQVNEVCHRVLPVGRWQVDINHQCAKTTLNDPNDILCRHVVTFISRSFMALQSDPGSRKPRNTSVRSFGRLGDPPIRIPDRGFALAHCSFARIVCASLSNFDFPVRVISAIPSSSHVCPPVIFVVEHSHIDGFASKTYGRPSANDPCTPRAERPPWQPCTLSVAVMGCSMSIWARTLRVDSGMDGFRGRVVPTLWCVRY
jgi:hypothetical protein